MRLWLTARQESPRLKIWKLLKGTPEGLVL